MLVPFAPPPGLNSDDTTFAAEGRWADGNNVRFRLGKAQVIGGWYKYSRSDAADDLFDGTCRHLHGWTANDGSTWLGVATSEALYAVGTDTTVITSVSGFSSTNQLTDLAGIDNFSTRIWSMALFGETLLANGYVEDGSGTADNSLWVSTKTADGGLSYANVTQVTEAPVQITWIITTPQRQVLALGCNEEISGTFNPLCIRGCDIEDYTDWTSTTTNNAFEHIITGGGRIVRGEMVGPYVAIWTDQELWLGTYIGDPSQTYRFDRVGTSCGLRSSNCLCIADGIVYWVSNDGQFRRWAPGGPVEHIPCPISIDYLSNSSVAFQGTTTGVDQSKYFLGYNPMFGEIWFFYADTRDGSPTTATRYVAFTVADGAWFKGQMVRHAWCSTGPAVPLAAAASGYIYWHERGTADGATFGGTGGVAINWHLTSADQYIEDSEREIEVQRFIPDFEGQVGSVKLSVNVRARPQSSATTKGPYTITTSATKKDFRASGKIISIKLEDADAQNSFMRLGKPLFYVVPKGTRV